MNGTYICRGEKGKYLYTQTRVQLTHLCPGQTCMHALCWSEYVRACPSVNPPEGSFFWVKSSCEVAWKWYSRACCTCQVYETVNLKKRHFIPLGKVTYPPYPVSAAMWNGQ